MPVQRDYFCPACEWTDRADKKEMLTECPICGTPLTELTADVPENPLTTRNPPRYDPEALKKVADEDAEGLADEF